MCRNLRGRRVMGFPKKINIPAGTVSNVQTLRLAKPNEKNAPGGPYFLAQPNTKECSGGQPYCLAEPNRKKRLGGQPNSLPVELASIPTPYGSKNRIIY